MANYSDYNTRQLYDLIFDYVTLQLGGLDKSDQLKLLKAEADNREVGLYEKALNEAMSSHVPYVPVDRTEYEEPEYISVLSESLIGTRFAVALVSGNEMSKHGLYNNQYVLYEKDRLPQNNDIVLVKYENQVMINNYKLKNDKIVLSTSSVLLPDIVLDESVKYKILGIVRLSLNKV